MRKIPAVCILLALSGFTTKIGNAALPTAPDPAVYSIQDGMTVWGPQDGGAGGDISPIVQIPATNYLGNVVMFPTIFHSPDFGPDESYNVLPSTAVFSTIAVSPTGGFFNNSSPTQRPDFASSPWGFNLLTDLPPSPDFTISGDNTIPLLMTAQAFQNNVYFYCGQPNEFPSPNGLGVMVYKLPAQIDAVPTPAPTPALLAQGNPTYARNGTWDAFKAIAPPFAVQALASTVEQGVLWQDGSKHDVVTLWLGGNGQIAVYRSDIGKDGEADATSFSSYATIEDAGGTVTSLSAAPIVFANQGPGSTGLAQGQGTLVAWITSPGTLHAAIVTENAAGEAVISPVIAVDSTFAGGQFDSVQVAAGTARSGTTGVNAVQFFLANKSEDAIWRAEYIIPQNSAGTPQAGSFTSIGGAYLFVPTVNGVDVTASRLCADPASLTLVTATDPQPVPNTSNAISVLQDEMVILGSGRDSDEGNTLTALILKSNVLRPWGVDNTGTATPDTISTPRDFSDDYTKWKLLGVVMGVPPFTTNSGTDLTPAISGFEIATASGTGNTYEQESEKSISVGIKTDEDLPVSTEDRLTYSYFFSQKTSKTTVGTIRHAVDAITSGGENKAFLLVLAPNVTTQLYKMVDWANNTISLDGTTAGEYIYYQTSYNSPTVLFADFDPAHPSAVTPGPTPVPVTPWSNGFTKVFPDLSDLDAWSISNAPMSELAQPKNIGLPFLDAGTYAQPLQVAEGESAAVSFAQETESETNNTDSTSLELSDLTFGFYSGHGSTVTTTVTTTSSQSLDITMTERLPTGPEYDSFTVNVYGFVQNSTSNPDWMLPAYKGQIDNGANPFLFVYALTASSKHPTPTPDPALQPHFSVTPASQEIPFGKPVQLDAIVSNPSGVTFQWFKDGKPIPNAVGPILILQSPTFDDTGAYQIAATNIYGTTDSPTAHITVAKTPVFTKQPNKTSVAFPGGDARFEATATGAGTLIYQWYLNGQPVSGATKSVFTFKNIPATLAPYASVFVKATNAGGTASSSVCRLNVVRPPEIVSPPADTMVRVGDTASFEVAATSENPISYSWFVNDALVPDETSPRLLLRFVALSDNGSKVVAKVSGKGGFVGTTPATLTVASSFPGALITRGSQTVPAGRAALFSIQLAGTETIQWFHDGKAVPGATATTLSIPKAGAADIGLYTVRLTNSKGTTEVVVGMLRVNKAPPAFVKQPESRNVAVGGRAVFTARVTSRGPVSYVWLRNGRPVSLPGVSGVTTNRLVFSRMDATKTGAYVLKATNAFGSVMSRTVRLKLR